MNLYVLSTDVSQGNYQGDFYRFRGMRGEVLWPKQEGFGLGTVGAWNVLFRLGFAPRIVTAEQLPLPRKSDSLFLCAHGAIDDKLKKAVISWEQGGGTVVMFGDPRACNLFLPLDSPFECAYTGYPYAALSYLHFGDPPEIVAPSRRGFLRFPEGCPPDLETWSVLAAVRGERQTPERALITPIDNAPAVIKKGGFFFLNGNPFGAFQAWLQGQEDLEPWVAWRHRLFWLDELAAMLGRILHQCGAIAFPSPGPGIEGLGETTIVFRHDLDHSRDTAYLDAEISSGLPGVHAILKDENTKFWVQLLKAYPDQESAFHYKTNRNPGFLERIVARFTGKSITEYRPARRDLCRNDLLRQVQWARSQNIGVTTLHRHASFLIYPEIIDALDKVYRTEPEVLGSSSFFRAQVLRWGTEQVDGATGTVGAFPDAQFPLWFPFKLAHAGRNGRLLRGWESTSMMEIEPEIFYQMLTHDIPELPQRVFTLNFHPAHANQPTFTRDGSIKWFREILRIAQEYGCEFSSLRNVYERLDKI